MAKQSRYSMSVPSIIVKEHSVRGGQVRTSCFAEFGGTVFDNLKYEQVVLIEGLLNELESKLVEAAAVKGARDKEA